MSLSLGLSTIVCLGSVASTHAATREIVWGKKSDEPLFLTQFALTNDNAPSTLLLPASSAIQHLACRCFLLELRDTRAKFKLFW